MNAKVKKMERISELISDGEEEKKEELTTQRKEGNTTQVKEGKRKLEHG